MAYPTVGEKIETPLGLELILSEDHMTDQYKTDHGQLYTASDIVALDPPRDRGPDALDRWLAAPWVLVTSVSEKCTCECVSCYTMTVTRGGSRPQVTHMFHAPEACGCHRTDLACCIGAS